MCFSLRKSNRATSLSDKFFEKLYNSEKSWYAKHLKRAAKFTRTPFDKTAAEAEFDQNYKDNLEFVKSLPDEKLYLCGKNRYYSSLPHGYGIGIDSAYNER